MKRILMTATILSLTVNCATTLQGRYQDVGDPLGAVWCNGAREL